MDVILRLPELRPEAEHAFRDFVLLSNEAGMDEVSGSWQATLDGVDDLFEGSLRCAVGEARDVTERVKRWLDDESADV